MSIRKTSQRTAQDPHEIVAVGVEGEDLELVYARAALRPAVSGATTLKVYKRNFDELGLAGLVHALTEQVRSISEGDLSRAEELLIAQAHTLDAIFNDLARRAVSAQYQKKFDLYLKLALRAQSQCRATLETLSTIKNPPMPRYVNQANIAHGHQQVNNTRYETEFEISKSELLEDQHGEWMDLGETQAPGEADTAVAALGGFDRTED